MFDWSTVTGQVMGVVNVTPDSFSDGGRYLDPDAAVAHGLALASDGAAVLDVGGESTRPGAEPVAVAEEIRRVVPVIRALAARTGVPVSVDTTKAAVAAAAIDAGATIVNDVSAGRKDAALLGIVADTGAGFVAMHMQGEPRTMQVDPHYEDVVREVGDFLAERLDVARAAGVAECALMADPGIGFGKTLQHNLDLLARLPDLAARVGVPLLVGTSRKSFIGRVLGIDDPAEREEGTLATVVWALEHGAAMVRVHEVRPSARASAMLRALRQSSRDGVIA